MNNVNLVFCVECNTLLSLNNAEKVFKTGYFKTTIPLCFCKECANKENGEEDMDVLGISQDCYAYSAMALTV
ncbi:hypothetical protein [Paenibacillus aestuarii]|uniref:Uncharacterized protein n=1 Tax=Paenibacillus aestuarii TaxID=516965 RepID=A0ABW0K138_9BACL|nr:hypothetical protein [Paenibacillus aestuarii]